MGRGWEKRDGHLICEEQEGGVVMEVKGVAGMQAGDKKGLDWAGRRRVPPPHYTYHSFLEMTEPSV